MYVDFETSNLASIELLILSCTMSREGDIYGNGYDDWLGCTS